MIGKKNIVFGFIYLVATAALGPYMVQVVYPDLQDAGSAKQSSVARLQLMVSNDFEANLEPLTGKQIAQSNTNTLLALNTHLAAQETLNAIKGGPHAHGNLEALLNIAAGLTLCFLAIAPLFKQLISWLFLLGTLLHSGILYLVVVFQLPWAQQVLGTGIGPILLLVGLLLAGIAAAIGFRGTPVVD